MAYPDTPISGAVTVTSSRLHWLETGSRSTFGPTRPPRGVAESSPPSHIPPPVGQSGRTRGGAETGGKQDRPNGDVGTWRYWFGTRTIPEGGLGCPIPVPYVCGGRGRANTRGPELGNWTEHRVE